MNDDDTTEGVDTSAPGIAQSDRADQPCPHDDKVWLADSIRARRYALLNEAIRYALHRDGRLTHAERHTSARVIMDVLRTL